MRSRQTEAFVLACLLIIVAAAPAAAQSGGPHRLFLPLVVGAGGPVTVTAVADAYIYENGQDLTGALPYLIAGYDGDEATMEGISRTLIRFDLPAIDPDAVKSVKLRVYYLDSADFPDQPRTVTVRQVLGPWEEMDVRWNVRPGEGPAQDSITINSSEAEGYREWDITQLAQEWLSQAAANNGVYLTGPEESGSDWAYRVFESREAAHPPLLVIERP